MKLAKLRDTWYVVIFAPCYFNPLLFSPSVIFAILHVQTISRVFQIRPNIVTIVFLLRNIFKEIDQFQIQPLAIGTKRCENKTLANISLYTVFVKKLASVMMITINAEFDSVLYINYVTTSVHALFETMNCSKFTLRHHRKDILIYYHDKL